MPRSLQSQAACQRDSLEIALWLGMLTPRHRIVGARIDKPETAISQRYPLGTKLWWRLLVCLHNTASVPANYQARQLHPRVHCKIVGLDSAEAVLLRVSLAPSDDHTLRRTVRSRLRTHAIT